MGREAGVSEEAVRHFGRRAARPRPIRARPATCWDEVVMMPVDVTVPDRASASALLGEAVSHCRAELVETAGSATVVRLLPARGAPAGWVFELLALVERWLEAHDLKVARVHHGNQSYVITAPGSGGEWDGSPGPAVAA